MKAVLISIQPKWCEKIVNGEKTIEVRKSRPKIKTPFKCYIYETKGQYIKFIHGAHTKNGYGCGKVIGEFVCDEVYEWKTLYGWHISDIKIYDEPKELSEFQKPCKMTLPMCARCEHYSIWSGCCENITRPPQSYMYVEEL